MPRLRGRAFNTGQRTQHAQLVHHRRLNRTAEEHSTDNVNLRNQFASTRVNENSEQRNQRLRANTLRQREARQRASNALRECNQQRMQNHRALTRASFNRHAFEYDLEIDNSLQNDNYAIVIKSDKVPYGEHAGTYNVPTINEVAVVMTGDPTER
ncbi:uncharacterized protein TNIN_99841 [Trichonephila inaurata madagascariensis]|uniref:Uncharacterized protein n=1 Tax=Trichonephila inaurata madagascariensis TaxID=2747483 RepID=A0A8X6YUN1_9ARAC|nr:uncharacterized protein TNIN_99841 [Trichonephila inaurata madagascariensis]